MDGRKEAKRQRAVTSDNQPAVGLEIDLIPAFKQSESRITNRESAKVPFPSVDS